MKKVKVITTNNRGFLVNLFEYRFSDISFDYSRGNLYEVSGRFREILAKLIKSRVFDILGVFRIIDAKKTEADICFSYNRFLESLKPYVIYLENPSALVNYSWDRPKYILARIKLQKCFKNENLKYIVCMSQACYKNFGFLYNYNVGNKLTQIYPLIQDDLTYGEKNIEENYKREKMECLFISSQFVLKGGREIIYAFSELFKHNENISLTIVTKIDTIPEEDIEIIDKYKNIKLVEFNLTKEELNVLYKNADILLNPTRVDSFSLVTLEAMKYGCAILATDVYAIAEMVKEDVNGYLHKPTYDVWGDKGIFRKEYRMNKSNILQSLEIDETISDWLVEKMLNLESDRKLLRNLCLGSLNMARSAPFSEIYVGNQWESLLNEKIK